MSVVVKSMPSKFPGKCKSCGKSFDKGTMIIWSPQFGTFHRDCEIKINGKSVLELYNEWEEEHKDDMTLLERYEEMRVSSDYKNVDEDTLFEYASQDTPQNPYKRLLSYSGKTIIRCQEHEYVEAMKWEGENVCPYHQRVKQTDEGPVYAYEEFDQNGE